LRGVFALLSERERSYRLRQASNQAERHLDYACEISRDAARAEAFSHITARSAAEKALREAVKAEKAAREASSEATAAKHELEATVAFIKRLQHQIEKTRRQSQS
jgi:hypothetical protein